MTTNDPRASAEHYDELLTVDDVAALFIVPKTWVPELLGIRECV